MSETHPPAGRASPPAPAPPRDLATATALALCFLLGGLAALVYQTAWTRQFALVFGTSELAVATVLAAYMGGLALGARLAERWLPRLRRPVLAYAALELGIGASALLLVPALLSASDRLLVALFGGQPEPPGSDQIALSLFYLVTAFVALAVPTVLMGATLPLLARHAVRTEAQIGRRIGLLYAMNTAGAVAGALLTAFWLLPERGLAGAVRTGAAINLAVFVLAVLIARRVPAVPESAPPARRAGRLLPSLPATEWVLPLMLLSGAVSFFHEVLWTRMLSHVLGSSIHAFGVMVASFLTGIALGGGVGALLARDRAGSVRALALSQLGCAAAAAAAYLALERFLPQGRGLARTALFGAAILMPLTLCIGASFPLAVRILAQRAQDAAFASARVYAWNTVGAIAGALAGGFVLIPALRFEGAIRLAVLASAGLAVAAAWLLDRTPRPLAAAVTVGAVLAAALFRPDLPEALLRASPLGLSGRGPLVYYDVGRSASVVVLREDDALALRTNGLPESLTTMPRTLPRFTGEFWLSPMAVLARPQVRDLLIIGFGGGRVVEDVPPSVERVDVIEIEPLVLEANRAVRDLRARDPLADPRVHLVTNDARGALRLTDRRYDAIVSQPSHPWTAGASHLYSLEFMREVHAHLDEGGVFVQWMGTAFVSEPLLRALAATFLAAFEHLRIYRPDPATLLFLASDQPLDVEPALAAGGAPLDGASDPFARVGIRTVEDLVGALVADREGAERLAAGAAPITDDDNRLATSTLYLTRGGMTPEEVGRLLASYDPLQQPGSWVFRELGERLSFDAIARRQLVFAETDASVPERLSRLVVALDASPDADATRIAARAHGRGAGARRLARAAFERHPEDARLRYAVVEPFLAQLARGSAEPEIVAAASGLTGAPAALVEAERLAAAGRWEEIAELESALAGARWTDPWQLAALEARAAWRCHASQQPRLGDEGIALVDTALLAQPTKELYALRARCASVAGRPDALVESLRMVAVATYLGALQQPSRRSAAIEELEAVVETLGREAGRDGVDRVRLEEVRERIAEGIRTLRGS
jgi:spermidine synthase